MHICLTLGRHSAHASQPGSSSRFDFRPVAQQAALPVHSAAEAKEEQLSVLDPIWCRPRRRGPSAHHRQAGRQGRRRRGCHWSSRRNPPKAPAQRAAAAAAGAAAAAPAAAEEKAHSCVVCFDAPTECTLAPCGHKCMCQWVLFCLLLKFGWNMALKRSGGLKHHIATCSWLLPTLMDMRQIDVQGAALAGAVCRRCSPAGPTGGCAPSAAHR